MSYSTRPPIPSLHPRITSPSGNGQPIDVRQAALLAIAHQLSPLPPREDGTKAPWVTDGQWKQYQQERATVDVIHLWYGTKGTPKRSGCGLVTGAISGNLECLEFDACGRLYEPYKAMARALELGDLIDRLEAGYLERSPSGGYHWLYRCTVIAGNTKLAEYESDEINPKTGKPIIKPLIETRGEGGYIIVAPSNGQVHPSGGAYELLAGGFATIPTITPEERQALWDLARTLDELPKNQPTVEEPGGPSGRRPGDDFNARATWAEILTPAGWTKVFERDGVEYWRRPGKGRGHSATVNYGGWGLFHCFTSSSEFAADKSYGKFTAYTILYHNGDFSAAAQDLARKGFGTKPAGTGQRAETEGKELTPADLGVIEAHTVIPVPVTWEWKDRIAKGKFFLVLGEGADGKSQITIRIIASYSTGSPFPGETGAAPCCDVLSCQAEDGLKDTVVPRLLAAGADLTRIKFVKPTRRRCADDGKTSLIDPQSLQDLDYWEDLLALYPKAGLLVLDPIPSYIGRGVNDYKNADLRQVLDPFFDLMEMKGVTTLGVTHTGKAAEKRRAIHRALGSVAYTNRARGAFGTNLDDDDPSGARRLFCHIKPYNAKLQPTLVYRIVSTPIESRGELIATSKVEFLEGTDTRSAEQVMNPRPSERRQESQDRRDRLAQWLKQQLADGPMESDEVKQRARAAGFGKNLLWEVKTEIGIQASKDGMTGKWSWSLNSGQHPGMVRDASKEERENF